MLYHLLYPLAETIGAFNVFRYITFRTAAATLTALFLSFLLGPPLIRALGRLRVGQPIREIGPNHQEKEGTPTMGGLLILLSLIVSVLLWANLESRAVWIVLGLRRFSMAHPYYPGPCSYMHAWRKPPSWVFQPASIFILPLFLICFFRACW